MPFKLKLKKTRQYNVASKSLFVISVELLDGGVADCTLSVDSTGQECLDNVCQRQAINQPEFFGLRYVNRSQQSRWVQLDRPLKRQLDKHASSHQLYLRVMYYVISGTSLITDEVTRYHYFLQLKNDLIEGRIICDCQQAVVLASYSRQAEYGNHDRERHTVEYLKNLLTFPKQMLDGGQLIDGSSLAETGRLEWLTAAVIQHHMSLHNMSQAQAEEGFITSCQQLRGYGQEMFSAVDQRDQSEVTIAVSLTGVRVLADTSDTPHVYRWSDITNVINHKRTFSIECQRPAGCAAFSLPSPEGGKYVWRMCVLQHTFYMRHRGALSAQRVESAPNFQEHGLSESREELDVREVGSASRLEPLTAAHRAHSTSCLELADHRPQPRNRALLPSYRPAPDYETAIQQKYQQQRAEAQLRYQNHHAHSLLATAKPLAYGSHPDIHRHYPDVTRHTINQPVDDYPYALKLHYPFAGVQPDHPLHYVYKPPPPYPSNGLASNSTPDLAVASQALNYHRGYVTSHVSGSSPDLVSTRTALNRQYLGYLNPSAHVMNYSRANPVIPGAHGTYNNLPSVLDPNPHIIMDPHHVSDNIQKVYDERGNIMYSMPLRRISYPRHVVIPQPKRGEQEPIYENVPLPWRDQPGRARDRAQSLTSTDEIARLNCRNTIAYANKPVPPAPYAKEADSPDSHYENAHIIKGVRESSLPKDLNRADAEFENVALSIDRLSVKTDDKEYDETPYQSLSTHRVSNNNTITKSSDNVTSIIIPDVRIQCADNSTSTMSSGSLNCESRAGGLNCTENVVGALKDSTESRPGGLNSAENLSGSSKESTESQAGGLREKKRRRWAVFLGRGARDGGRSATLGRERAAATPPPAAKHRWSTGLPKQPLPPSITKETLCQVLERRIADDQLSFSFERVAKGRERDGEHGAALLARHAALNGAAGSLPYEDNRVRLAPSPDNPHGYINASHITMTVGSGQRFYALVQTSGVERAPLVWQCAWQLGARLVALVGAAAADHLPPDRQTKDYGQVSCGKWSRAAWGGSVRVRVRCGARARHLWHVHYTRWADDRPTPDDVAGFLEFLSELNGVRLACEAGDAGAGAAGGACSLLASRNAPVLACAARAARAGLAVAADLLLHVVDTNQELDIPRTVTTLHQQRANLIENVHQYRFLHQVLLQYLTQSRLI